MGRCGRAVCRSVCWGEPVGLLFANAADMLREVKRRVKRYAVERAVGAQV